MFTGGSVFVQVILTNADADECATLQGDGLEAVSFPVVMVIIPFLFHRGFAPSMRSGPIWAGAVDVASKFIPQYVIYTHLYPVL
jgi:hypothetical protein